MNQTDLPECVESYSEIVKTFCISLKDIRTEITVRIKLTGNRFYAETSHFIHTPVQATPYYPDSNHSNSLNDYFIKKCIRSFTVYYDEAVSEGYTPSEEWLNPNENF